MRRRITPEESQKEAEGRCSDLYVMRCSRKRARSGRAARSTPRSTSRSSPMPTLVMSGELDPVTPPVWGEAIAKHLSNSRHVVIPGPATPPAERMRAAAHQRVHRRASTDGPRHELRRNVRAAAVLRDARRTRSRGSAESAQPRVRRNSADRLRMIRIENLHKRSARCARSTACPSSPPTARSRACSARTAPARPRRCACSTR